MAFASPAVRVYAGGMAADSDILIVGGGLNGPALALALAQGGFTATVVDALPRVEMEDADFDGRAYALALGSVRMLRALGLWSEVEGHAQPILDIVVSDGRPGEGAAPWTLHFDHAELEEGPMGQMLEDRHLRRALLARLDATPGVQLIDGRRVVDHVVDDTGVSAQLDDGRTLRARLIVGADGRDSPTAARAGIGRKGHGYDQTGIVCALSHEKPHHGVAHQFFMPAGPLGILPLPGNRCSIVWAEDSVNARRIMALSDEAFLAELRPRFGDFLGRLRLEGRRFAYPLRLTVADRFTASRLALVGDAAHGMHPLAGQGLNMGLRDVAALAEVLWDARRRGEDPGAAAVLHRYLDWRRDDQRRVVAVTDGLVRLFTNPFPPLAWARSLGLALLDVLPPGKRLLARQFMGFAGRQPRLARGLRLEH